MIIVGKESKGKYLCLQYMFINYYNLYLAINKILLFIAIIEKDSQYIICVHHRIFVFMCKRRITI